MNNYGAWLINFLEWCVAKGKCWKTVSYVDDILFGYQNDMAKGLWSVRHEPLKPGTINPRADEACRFLSWAAKQELREPFDVASITVKALNRSSTSTVEHTSREQVVRLGAVRPNPISLRIPTDAEIDVWLRSVRVKFGLTKALMCELVLGTAIRREETVEWQIDTLPEHKADWHIIGDEVRVHIKYGTKGTKTSDINDIDVGPERIIFIPISLAEKLHRYRELTRPKLLSIYVRAAETLQEKKRRIAEGSRRLFLSDSLGVPVSAQRFYDAWTQAPHLPYKGWSPHPGRHWWACKQLLLSCDRRIDLANKNDGTKYDEHGIVVATAKDVILMEIRPQLGHVSERTTQKYLSWVYSIYKLKTLHDDYGKFLEDVVGEFEVNENV